MYLRRSSLFCIVLSLLFLLSACGSTSFSPPTPQSGTVGVSTAGTAPIVLLTPTSPITPTPLTSPTSLTLLTPPASPTSTTTPAADSTPTLHFVTLADRALALGQVSKQPGADSSSTAISVTLTIRNTSTASIKNQATFYQLVGAEGDTFGTQSSVTPGFFGAIAPGQQRTGTIVFQIPSGAARGLRLLYRPEVATDTLLLPLPI